MFFEQSGWKSRFEVLFMEPAREFLNSLDAKARAKVLFGIDKSRFLTDTELFKKLGGQIWEFRTRYRGQNYRLLAFWDEANTESLVVATHGFIKKTQKAPQSEIFKAGRLRRLYLDNKKI